MICIKSFFGEWHEVEREQAIKFVKHLLSSALTSREKAIELINKKMLRGTTVEELL